MQAVAFCADCSRLATASYDNTVALWDLKTQAAPQPVRLTGHTDRVSSVVFSPNGSVLVSGSADGTARLWRLDAEEVAADVTATAYPPLTDEERRQYLSDDTAGTE
ncbi:hypothetical protein CLM62_03895 [Streptomyces sp. SA15]|uniref:WD40 repeat domain-containing protein n=1 Tax=Streptomyces sp. SA15 TaxID=934019 RepID=UPI000BAFA897|nr:hypothetical protein [Streptomyces sp. SA15]PAZ17138.1 hypothetical protein CLM62_03895 [Streptomyces sp. SA15]